jgi:type II secretory pathway pseudopilin PulG
MNLINILLTVALIIISIAIVIYSWIITSSIRNKAHNRIRATAISAAFFAITLLLLASFSWSSFALVNDLGGNNLNFNLPNQNKTNTNTTNGKTSNW